MIEFDSRQADDPFRTSWPSNHVSFNMWNGWLTPHWLPSIIYW